MGSTAPSVWRHRIGLILSTRYDDYGISYKVVRYDLWDMVESSRFSMEVNKAYLYLCILWCMFF